MTSLTFTYLMISRKIRVTHAQRKPINAFFFPQSMMQFLLPISCTSSLGETLNNNVSQLKRCQLN